jgi:thioredoxin reductase (NADPH)
VKPVILAVDDDLSSIGHISGELQRRYERDYRVVFLTSSSEALAELERMAERGERVALVLADQWMPEITGAGLLERVKDLHPRTKRALLISWGDWADEDTAAAVREAVARGCVDYYVLKPWKSPDELFHRGVTEYLHEWSRADTATPHEVSVVAPRLSSRAHAIRDLLTHNRVAHLFLDAQSEEGISLLERSGHPGADVPVVVLNDGKVLIDPDDRSVADAYGAMTKLGEGASFDVAIVGAGPGGLAAAVYAASEGLDALVIEQRAIGGQAGSSSMIRNYLGFNRGVEGNDLMQRAYQQAWIFGARFLQQQEVTCVRCRYDTHVLDLSDGSSVRAGAVILAMGVTYRMLEIDALERLRGSGVYYGASPSEAPHFAGGRVFLVGAGNSAGQAAIHLAKYAARVTIVVRGDALAKSMSSYLIAEIDATSNIDVLTQTQVVDGAGDRQLERLMMVGPDGSTTDVAADALFVLIGAQARTAWLPDEIARDPHGFVVTGADLSHDELLGDWRLARVPYPFETSFPGVFAVGDVRSRSVKRVANAVGEGSSVIQHVHGYFRDRDKWSAIRRRGE